MVRKKGPPFLPPLAKYMPGGGAGPDDMVRRKGHPFLPPMTKYMKGGVNAADTCRPKPDRDIFAKAMASFKCKVDIKGYDPFMNEAKWIHWWSQFRITLSSQGLNPVLDHTYTPDKTGEGIRFARMQATAFGILKTQVQTNTGKAIIRNHQGSLDTRAAITELVAYYRTSTRAIAIGHALHQERLTMRLTKDMLVS
jgi:hypothetical protein